MAKEAVAQIKLYVPAGQANPAPPVGPALGQHGVNIMMFCKSFNDKTKGRDPLPLPVVITVYKDKSFDFIIKTPPTSALIKKSAKLAKASGTAGKEVIGSLTVKQVEEIARMKMDDLNTIGVIEKPVPLQEAVNRLAKAPKVKFDETVELHFNLNLDLKASDQGVRGTVVLPHGIGKKVRVAAFCKGDAVAKAQAAGADYVGDNDLIEKVIGGFMDFDVVVASPDMMRDLSKLGKVLGPRGLMPTPKAGTVTADVERAIKEVKAGRVEFKSDKQGGIHLGIGKRSFAENKLVENARYVIEAVNHAKPSAVKGNLIKSLALATTMGPGVKVAL